MAESEPEGRSVLKAEAEGWSVLKGANGAVLTSEGVSLSVRQAALRAACRYIFHCTSLSAELVVVRSHVCALRIF